MLFAPEFPTTAPRRRPVRRAAAGAGLLVVGAVAAGLGIAASASAADTVWDRVALCESGANWSINTGNGYYGGLQFAYATWKGYGGQAYAVTADKATRDQQIFIAQKVLKVQGPGAWPVCSVRAGLTVTNGLAVVVNPGATTSTPTPTSTVTTVSRSYDRPLVVDGVVGPLTNGGIEKWVGGSVNGWLDVTDRRRLQVKVGSYPDGDIGPITTRALQRRVGAYPDGDWGPLTTKALQTYLNRVVYGR